MNILDQLKKANSERTQGKWTFAALPGGAGVRFVTTDKNFGIGTGQGILADMTFGRDGEFTALAASHMSALLAVVEAAEALVSKFDGEHDLARDYRMDDVRSALEALKGDRQ